MLTVVWAKKYFLFYLYGKKLLVRTVHAALSYLRTFADSISRSMQWSIRLSEFENFIEHKAGIN